MTVCEYRAGLEGIPATQSSISFVDGQRGILEYRGIPIEELGDRSTFLETAYLLIWGQLPAQEDLNDFEAEIQNHRRLKYRIRDMMKCFPESGHPMDALQACAAALGLFYSRRNLDDPTYMRESIVRLLAKIPTMVAAFQLMRKGNDPVQPRDDLSYAVVASAVGTLAGPLHGGASEEVIHMLEEIGSVDRVQEYIEERLATKGKIMGFGHRVYKVKDPRAKVLQQLAEKLFEKFGRDEYYDVAVELERVVAEKLGHRGIYPNVDFFSGVVYRKLGIPTDLFTPVFAISRTAGWLAHWREQLAENRIFRPTQIYTGLHDEPYVPISER